MGLAALELEALEATTSADELATAPDEELAITEEFDDAELVTFAEEETFEATPTVTLDAESADELDTASTDFFSFTTAFDGPLFIIYGAA